MNALLLPCIFLNSSFGQKSEIRFEQELTWTQIKEKAKKENKFIFVDCIATWCGPCKLMDKEVYSNDTVSRFLNSNFISVKVQMDTSKADDESIKKWYADAHQINKEYNVNAYPTFLFISPAGEFVHKGIGYHSVDRFVELTEDARNPEKQYFTQLAKYNQGVKDYSKMKYLANTAYRFNNGKVARKVAQDYINNYLLRLRRSKLFTKENIGFIRSYTAKSEDKSFWFLYNNAKAIDKLMNDSNFVEAKAHYIITMEEVQSKMQEASKSVTSTKPDWDKLGNTISEKYNSYYSDRVITEGRIRWHKWKKDWPEFCQNTVKYVTKYVIYSDDDELNERAWEVFLHSDDRSQLEAAMEWTQRVIKRNKDSTGVLPNAIDTHANLIYNINCLFNDKKDIQGAIQEEEKALEIALLTEDKGLIESFQETIKKMKSRIPTWSLPVSDEAKE